MMLEEDVAEMGCRAMTGQEQSLVMALTKTPVSTRPVLRLRMKSCRPKETRELAAAERSSRRDCRIVSSAMWSPLSQGSHLR
jgi:hypothetical protein